jgi:hypothetical protein
MKVKVKNQHVRYQIIAMDLALHLTEVLFRMTKKPLFEWHYLKCAFVQTIRPLSTKHQEFALSVAVVDTVARNHCEGSVPALYVNISTLPRTLLGQTISFGA